MKLLRKTIRKIILQEGMNTMEDLPADAYIRIKELDGGNIIMFQYAVIDERGNTKERVSFSTTDLCWGTVIIQKSNHQDGLWEVIESEAGNGWGPLLYDLAMEYASEGGQGLVSDRTDVSDGSFGAQNVWNFYMDNRSDVTSHQMDDMNNTLTPTPKDNIPQDIAKEVEGDKGWPSSALSKRYTKEPILLDKYEDRIIYQ